MGNTLRYIVTCSYFLIKYLFLPPMSFVTLVGRAFSIIRDTLPDFFKTGLVEKPSDDEDVECIYSPRIVLLYTPPTRLPPFPPVMHVEGLPLYRASSTFIRHTMPLFYNNLRVELRRIKETKGSDRERNFSIGIGVLGNSRLSGSHTEWDV
jgi:hypothetical protein